MRFSYQAIDADGDYTNDEINAESLTEAISQLQTAGLEVQSIQQVANGLVVSPVTSSDLLTQQFESSMQSSDRLIEELDAVAKEMPASPWRGQLQRFITALQSGATAKELATEFPRWAPLLVSGRQGDGSSAGIDEPELLDQLVQEQRRQRGWWRTLVYPVVLLLLAISVLLMMSWLIVPHFAQMFDEFGLMLPAPTRLVIDFSNELTQHPIRFFFKSAFLLGVAFATTWFFKSEYFAKTLRKNPSRVDASQLAEFTGHITRFLESGLNLESSLRLASRSCDSRFREISGGLVRSIVLKQPPAAGVLPANVVYALGFDSLDEYAVATPNIPLLRELTSLYRDRAAERDSNWQSVFSALAVLVVGIIVGFIVLALFMPLISLVSGLA